MGSLIPAQLPRSPQIVHFHSLEIHSRVLVDKCLAAWSSVLRGRCLSETNPLFFMPEGYPCLLPSMLSLSLLQLCLCIGPFVADSLIRYFLSFGFSLLFWPPLLDPLFDFQKSVEISYLLMVSLYAFLL